MMERWILLTTLLTFPLVVFWCQILFKVWRGQIYRADELVRVELNKMHRHTIWTAVLCISMLFAAAIFPTTRLCFGLSALIMLLGVLPLRTVFIEMGVRHNRNGKPISARLQQLRSDANTNHH